MDRERIYLPIASDQIVALDRESGARVWTADVESAWPPVVAMGTVFVAASDELHGLDAATGARRWRAPLSPAGLTMTFGDGRLIVTVEPGQVMAYAPDGRVIWSRSLEGAGGQMRASASGGSVYVSISSGRVVALDGGTGATRWERAIPGAMTVPAVARDRVIVGGADKRFYALDATSGSEEWTWTLGGTPVGAAVDDDLVVLTAMDNSVRAVNRGNGHQRWQETLATRPLHTPIAAGRLVVVPGLVPSLTGFAAKNGAAAGGHEGNASLAGPPLVDVALRPYAVAVVTIQRDGVVTGLRPESMLFLEPPAAALAALPGRTLSREPPPDALRPR